MLNRRMLRRLRRRRRLTQRDVGTALGLDQPYLSHLECGRRGCSVATLAALAQTLGVPMERLVQQRRKDEG